MQYPALFKSAEDVSATSQKKFLRVRAVELVALFLAACFGMIPRTELWGQSPSIALACFALVLVIQISGMAERAEKRWYDARAAAESVKSAAWQYAMGGEAFRRSDKTANKLFADRLQAILSVLPHLDVSAGSGARAIITDDMKKLRRASRSQRAAIYRRERVDDQLAWYSRKSVWNKRRAAFARWLLAVIEGAAIVLGILRMMGHFDVDWLGVFAVFASGIMAWQQIKNYASLSEAYAVTSHEVQIINSEIGSEANEDDWAQAVHDAEAAFSREHTLWLARKQGPRVTP